MLDRLDRNESEAIQRLKELNEIAALDRWHNDYLGTGSVVAKVMRSLAKLSTEDRRAIGRRANNLKLHFEAALEERRRALQQVLTDQRLRFERLDVTLPGHPVRLGRLHPATLTLRRILTILKQLGFQIFTSPEVETDEFVFQLLNFPLHHPARDMQDTFYLDCGERGDNPVLLRTQTSPGQIRAMRQFSAANPAEPPALRIAVPGMCFRNEDISPRKEVQFNQVEGLVVGKSITYGHLKGVLAAFARRMFGPQAQIRFRSSYFPFTEPSAEVDVECFVCGGQGKECAVCQDTGWLEILGCGMVHPIVLQNGGYDPRRFTGFAFGMGPERQAMLLHRINDIRLFWGNDIRFLQQF